MIKAVATEPLLISFLNLNKAKQIFDIKEHSFL